MKEKSLIELEEGEEGKVVRLIAGKKAKERLLSLGFIPNEKVKIEVNGGSCPILVEIKGAKIAVGRGLASRVIVKSLKRGKKR